MSIVCGTDFSERSMAAQLAAAAIASRLGAPELWLIHVIDPSLNLFDALTVKGLEEAATKRLEEEAARLAARTTARVRGKVASQFAADDMATAAEALWRFAEGVSAKLLIVSSRGYANAPLLRVGGTSERVALMAPLPVLVVRDPEPFEEWARGQRPLRVLVGVDTTRTAERAIRWTEELCRCGPCDVVVGSVYRPVEAARRYGLAAALEPEVERLLLRDLEGQARISGAWRVTYRCKRGVGRAGDHLLELAESEAVDLIVVGTHQRRGLGRLASVSRVALHFSHASVACVPAPREETTEPRAIPRLERILIATDFSPFGNIAVAYGFALLAGRGGEVYLVHVAPRGDHPGDLHEHVDLVAQARALVPELAPDQGVVTRIEVVHGDDPARAICETADRVGADAVCVASHGRSGIRRAVLGSVAESILRQARKPVFVVRPPPP